VADQASEQKRLIEAMVQRELDAAAAQRGWDLGAQAHAMLLSSSGANFDSESMFMFSTGYNGTITIVPFTFDFSALDGPDNLI
jgi:hypothetical protein